MNKLKGSIAAKVIAIILLALSCLALCGAVSGALWLESVGGYDAPGEQEMLGRLIDDRLDNNAYALLDKARYTPVSQLFRDEAVRFELLDENGELLYGSLGADETVQRSQTVEVRGVYRGMYYSGANEPLACAEDLNRAYVYETTETGPEMTPEDADDEPSPLPTPHPASAEPGEQKTPEGTRVCFIRMSWTDQSGDVNADMEMRLLLQLFSWRYALIGVAAGAFVLAVLLFVFLMAAAGHHDASGEVKAGFVEKIPADLLWLLGLAGMAALGVAVSQIFEYTFMLGGLLAAALCLVIAGLLLLLCLMSTAVRLKLGTFLSSCLIWRVLRWCWKWIKAAFRACGKLLRGLPLVWKWIPPFLILFVIDFAYTINNRRSAEALAFGLVLKALLLAAAILYLALCFQRLRKGAKAIAAGDEAVVIDKKYMLGDVKEHAEDLMHIRDGLSRAVDERMKSERLRTELITNVSHDIKTPLTAIVSYVDLLSREEIGSEKAGEYIEVLQRQSARLKKLTDDLVEASKASTGNLPVAKERLELGVLLDQTAGEYGERLAEKQLDLRVTKPAEPLYVQADPRHLWRMLDNLMNNILKYAQPGTRVYLDLACEGGRAALSFRNISAAPLNIRPEELTERFVRGDASRSTEGSGLGLAITASLAKLQGIDMELSVDGDLFKVVLRF